MGHAIAAANTPSQTGNSVQNAVTLAVTRSSFRVAIADLSQTQTNATIHSSTRSRNLVLNAGGVDIILKQTPTHKLILNAGVPLTHTFPQARLKWLSG